MSALQGVVLRAEGRGFIVAERGRERHQTPRHARRQAWFMAMPADDRACVEAWLRIWAIQERHRRVRQRQALHAESAQGGAA